MLTRLTQEELDSSSNRFILELKINHWFLSGNDDDISFFRDAQTGKAEFTYDNGKKTATIQAADSFHELLARHENLIKFKEHFSIGEIDDIKLAWNQFLWGASTRIVNVCSNFSGDTPEIFLPVLVKADLRKKGNSIIFESTISDIDVSSNLKRIKGEIKITWVLLRNNDGILNFKLDSVEYDNALMRNFCMNETVTLPNENRTTKVGDSATPSPDSSTVYKEKVKPSFFKRISNWCKRHPILTGLMIGVAAPLLVVGGAIGIIALAHALPVLAPAALFVGGIAAMTYGALHVLHIVGVAATATAIATPAVVGGTVGFGTGAIVRCSTAKVMGKTGANAGNKIPQKAEVSAKDSSENESTSANCLITSARRLFGK